MIFDKNLRRSVELYKMLKLNPKIRASVFGVIRRIVDFVLQGPYNPQTIEFSVLSPRGETNKIFMVLQVAEILDTPLPEYNPHPGEASEQMVGFVNSLYSAILGHNSEVAMFMEYCPDLATNIYAISNFIYDHFYQYTRKDFSRQMVWDSYDHKDPYDAEAYPDFVIVSHIPVE